MSWKPKRLYVEQVGDHFNTVEDLSDLAVKGKSILVTVYELVGSGTLRCDPTLSLATLGPLISDGDKVAYPPDPDAELLKDLSIGEDE